MNDVGSGMMDGAPSDSVVSAFVRLVRAQRCVVLGIEQAIKDAGFPPIEWYDVLWELEREGPSRPRDVKDRLLFPQSNLSRLLDRMEAARLIERHICQDDGRGQVVTITDEGKRMRRRMWKVHAAAIQTGIGAHLSDKEAAQLAGLLDRLRGCCPPSE
jgi:DNA-binding MarR family transcriptional regulator